MTTTTYTQRVLTADEGKFLTQSAEVALCDRVVTQRAFLAANAQESDWREITAEEAAEIERAKEEESAKAAEAAEAQNT